MTIRRLKFCFVLFYIYFALSFSKKSRGKLKFPFSKIILKNKYSDSFILNLSCNEKFSNTKECAEKCYYREKNLVECVAFVKFNNTEECKICNPATTSEVRNSNNTQNNDYVIDLLYILRFKAEKPVMYLPLDGDNITGATVIGDGITGTIIHEVRTQIQAGKVNQGLHLRNRARLFLDNTANTCLGNLSICTNGLSIALWINPSSLSSGGRHITHSEYSINIVATASGTISVWTSGQPNSLRSFRTQSTAPMGTWTHVAVVFDPDVGMFIYMNGILDAFKSINEAFSRSSLYGPRDYVFGGKGTGWYYFEGTLDEIKVFYESLTSAGKQKNGYLGSIVGNKGRLILNYASALVILKPLECLCLSLE